MAESMTTGRASGARLKRLWETVRNRDGMRPNRSDNPDLADLFDLDRVDYQVVANVAFDMVRISLTADSEVDACSEHWDTPILHKSLRSALLTDPLLERVLSTARGELLRRVTEGNQLRSHEQRLMVSIACQSFNNEYVWAESSSEKALVAELAMRIRAASVPPAPGTVVDLLTYAMYRPVWDLTLTDSEALSATFRLWPDSEALMRRIRARDEESRICDGLETFGMSLHDDVSLQVHAQYEESPYPQWFGITVGKQESLFGSLARRFPMIGQSTVDRRLDVLVAGCGTGKHPIALAARFSDANVVAIDVSRASLAVSSRMATELGVSNIRFLQGDLRCVDQLDVQFDVIEAIGVLHHLSDPSAGLRALSSVLKPNGHMKVGVYSTRARRDLRSLQRRSADMVSAEGEEGFRRLRQEVLWCATDENAWLLRSRDFFYSSGCRDLLRHAHEVSFTPAELKGWLGACGLKFLGYVGIDHDTAERYRERFPEDSEMLDLDCWEAFELDHPHTFRSLQVFWLQPGSNGGES